MSNVDEADSREQLQLQRWQWRIERCAWGLIALLLVAALLGYLGRGPLTWSEDLSPEGDLLVKHYSLEHCQCATELRLALNEPGDDGPAEIAISRSFLDATTPLGIWPPPANSWPEGDEMVFTFNIEPDSDQREIVYRYEHETFGPLSYEVSLNGQPPVVVKQFVFP